MLTQAMGFNKGNKPFPIIFVIGTRKPECHFLRSRASGIPWDAFP